MASLIISDLFLEGDFCQELTTEELKMNVFGGAVGAGSVSAGQYFKKGDLVEETAVTATVASSRRQSFSIELSYSFEPRLYVSAKVY